MRFSAWKRSGTDGNWGFQIFLKNWKFCIASANAESCWKFNKCTVEKCRIYTMQRRIGIFFMPWWIYYRQCVAAKFRLKIIIFSRTLTGICSAYRYFCLWTIRRISVACGKKWKRQKQCNNGKYRHSVCFDCIINIFHIFLFFKYSIAFDFFQCKKFFTACIFLKKL